MKRLYGTWEECLALKEVRSLVEMSSANHPNIIQLEEVIRETDCRLYFVFEYMPDGNLYDFIKRHTPLPNNNPAMLPQIPVPLVTEHKIQSILSQALNGIAFLHSKGYVHRDIKPENLLLKGDTVKLADFGLARECACQSPLTEYVSTRWYRAPEVLLRSKFYGKPVDLFAIGCIMAELYSKIPLFPGDTEPDQVSKLVDVLGSPKDSWEDGLKLAEKFGWLVDRKAKYTLESRVPAASKSAVALMKGLLQWNPHDRPTCEESLMHEFFIITRKHSLDDYSSLSSPPAKRVRLNRDISPRSAIQDLLQAQVVIPEISPRSINDLVMQPYINPLFYGLMPSVPFY